MSADRTTTAQDDDFDPQDYVHEAGCAILEEFAEHQARYRDHMRAGFLRGETVAQSVESYRRAYRERNTEAGRCRSCSCPARPGRKSCETHLAKNNARAHASLDRRGHDAG